MELDQVQIRILGCLVEKETTTPDNYPLSTNALVNACNQNSNRDPVVDYDERTVDQAMLDLRGEGLARTVTGGRANKHRHVLDEAWGLGGGELALLAVLFLRGPQTVGELRGRAERMHAFDDLDVVDATLESLAQRSEPYVRQLDRQPGQKERRWTHLLAGAAEADLQAPQGSSPEADPAEPPAKFESASDQSELLAELRRLRADVDRLYDLLGETPQADE